MSTVADIVKTRGITEIVHFTTNHGLVGVFDRGALCSRDDLNEDQRLDSVKLLNCDIRKDPNWTGYVNLSISTVNPRMLGASRTWHDLEDIWWAVLSFAPKIMEHEGVWFTTTNNIYTDTVRRGQGARGLADIFTEPIPWGYYNHQSWRGTKAPCLPTNDQAEVLYPREVSLDYLQAIYVPAEDHLDEIEGWVATFPEVPRVPVEYRPEVFQG